MYKNYKKIIAGFLAAAMIAPTTAGMTDMQSTHAFEILGETTFDHKILPWHTVEVSPAKQYFELSEGAVRILIQVPEGAEKKNGIYSSGTETLASKEDMSTRSASRQRATEMALSFAQRLET